MKTFLALIVAFFAMATAVYAEESVTIAVTEFRGEPQYHSLEIFNSGDLTLEMRLNGHELSEVANGEIVVERADGRKFVLRNMWTCSDGICIWEQYIPYEIQSLQIKTPTTIFWKGYGPWDALADGLRKSKLVTVIQLRVEGPVYRDWENHFNPTWDWNLQGYPQWAAQEWFNAFEDSVSVEIQTSCDGHADNHEGNFQWGPGLYLGQTFGNGVSREWILDPMYKRIVWKVSGEGGWFQTGFTQGPTCWRGKSFLPLG